MDQRMAVVGQSAWRGGGLSRERLFQPAPAEPTVHRAMGRPRLRIAVHRVGAWHFINTSINAWLTKHQWAALKFEHFIIVILLIVVCGMGWQLYKSHGVSTAGTVVPPYSLVAAKSVIRITGTRPYLRNKENGLPFSVNIGAISDEPLTEVFMQDDLLTPIGEISPELMKSNFENLRLLADIGSEKHPELGQDIEPKREDFRTVRRASFTDNTVDAILRGHQRLYIIALWKYKIQGSSDFNVKYLCVFYVNTFDHSVTCPGPYNGTFAYKAQGNG
jgi:hypothetical protein